MTRNQKVMLIVVVVVGVALVTARLLSGGNYY